MYRDGLGVQKKNTIEAHKWFNLANARGNAKAARAQAEIEAYMTADKIEQSQKLARDWTAAHPHLINR